jgi:hypothetical protein
MGEGEMMEMADIIGSLWEYGALIVVLSFAVFKLWQRVNYLQDQLIQLVQDYTDAIHELTDLIKGDVHDDSEQE